MLFAVALLLQPDRTPSVYRCPRIEGETEKMHQLIDEEYYDTICIDPAPGPKAKTWGKGKVKFIKPQEIDTPANLKWRNATIAFASGKISPAEWLKRTQGLKETYHFLTSPKTKPLRDELWWVPVDPGGTFSARSVFAEMLLLSWPGVPVLCSSDVYSTKAWPEKPGQFESWILAMNDYRGPMLYYRFSKPDLLAHKPKVLHADSSPGLLTFQSGGGKQTITFTFNNSFEAKPVSISHPEHMTICRGLDLDADPPRLNPAGSMIEDLTEGVR